jgi:transcription initiation factor TFIIB
MASKVLNPRFAYMGMCRRLVSPRNEVIKYCDGEKHSSVVAEPESGEIICVGCGTVIANRMFQISPTWDMNHHDVQSFTRDRVNVSFSLNLTFTNLSTVIGKENRDASGRRLDPRLHEKLSNLRKWDHIVQFDSETRNLNQVISLIRRCKEKLGLQYSVIDRTARIYRKVQLNKLVRGRTTQAVLAACVYIACRQVGIPRTLTDVARANNITCKEISSAYRLIVLKFDLKMPSIDQMHYLVRLANSTGVGEKVKRHSIRIMNEIIKKELSAGKDPMGLAAAVLYLICQLYGDDTKTQRYFADIAGVTDVTIRNRCSELKTEIMRMVEGPKS